VDGQVLRGFNFDHDHPYAAGQHRGIDISAAVGAFVLAPAEGVVSFAGTVPNSGRTVSIQTPSGTTVTLLQLGAIEVRRGARVNEGSTVGSAGPSDDPDVPEPHVSMGIRTTADPQGYLDPLAFLPPRVTPESPAAESPAPAAVVVSEKAPASDPPAVEPPAASVPDEPAVGDLAGPAPSVEPTESRRPVIRQATAGAPAAAAGSAQPAVLPSADPAPAPVAVEQPSPAAATAPAAHAPDATVDPVDLRKAVEDRRASVGAAGTPALVEAATTGAHEHGGLFPIWTAALAVALLGLGAVIWRRRVSSKAVRMMDHQQSESALARNDLEERPRRAGVAVCVGPAPPRSCGGLRSARGHLRAVPPAEGEPCPDGEWDGRARDAGDGDGGQGRRLAA
jgi:hypothetical protein